MSEEPSVPKTPLSAAQVYRRLFRFLREQWGIFLIGVLATGLGSGLEASLAFLPKPLIDDVLTQHNPWMVTLAPIAVIAIFIVRNLMAFISMYCITRVGRRIVMQFRQKIFIHLMKLPAGFFDQNSSGKLLSTLLYNVEQLAAASTDALINLLREGCKVIGLLIVMFTMNGKLSLVFLTTAPIIAVILRFSSRRLRAQNRHVQDSMGEVSHVAEESIEGYRVIRTFGGIKHEITRFIEFTTLNFKRELKVAVTSSLGSASVQWIASLPIALILYLATRPDMNVTAGEFAAILGSMLLLLPAMRRLTQVNPAIQRGVASAQSIFELLEEPVEADNGTLSLSRAQGRIVFDHVFFRYPQTEKWALKNVSFIVEPGETIALVGPSGAGKSTLASILPRFYEVTSGQILIDDQDIRDYQLADLRQQFALVSQHITLFSDTVANNIAYGNLGEATVEEVWKAAELAHAAEFIRELPQGMDTLIGENGVKLSGGQRQRLAIARAILKNAPILVLDEATSALDSESERHIQSALIELMKNRTTVVIAHRLSTIVHADRILVMHKGALVETGTHDTLLAMKNGHYAKLYKTQFKKST